MQQGKVGCFLLPLLSLSLVWENDQGHYRPVNFSFSLFGGEVMHPSLIEYFIQEPEVWPSSSSTGYFVLKLPNELNIVRELTVELQVAQVPPVGLLVN